MVQQGKYFKAWKVDVRGLSRKQAAKKRNAEYRAWKLSQELKEVYREEISSFGKVYTGRNGKVVQKEYPAKDGKSTRHRPLRNYWGNLHENNTYNEGFNRCKDHEDDHDGFYGNNQLWK